MLYDLIIQELARIGRLLADSTYTNLADIGFKEYSGQARHSREEAQEFMDRHGRSQVEALVFAHKTDFSCQTGPIDACFFADTYISIVGEACLAILARAYGLGLEVPLSQPARRDLASKISQDQDKLARQVENKLQGEIN